MWLALSNSFISVVADRENPDKLLVRSRFPDDITRLFPNAKLFSKPNYDYKYRSLIDRKEVAKVISNQLLNIDYDNFKDSVLDPIRHNAYLDIWQTMFSIQR